MTEFKTLGCLQELNIDCIWATRNVFAKSLLTQWYTYFYSSLITVETIKILFAINSLKRKLFRQHTICSSFRLKKKTLNFDEKNLCLIKKKLYGNLIDNKAHYKILFTIYFA